MPDSTKSETKPKRSRNSNAVLPLPSFIRASATDQANMAMRAAGRSAWNGDDYDLAAATLDRLIRACYSAPGDPPKARHCYLRFSLAEQMQRRGLIGLHMSADELFAAIDRQVIEAGAAA